VGPLFIALFFADAAPLGVGAIAVASIGIAAVMARIAYIALPGNTWVNAPSMTVAWLAFTRAGGVVVALLLGAATVLVCVLARRMWARHGTLARAATLAAPLLVLNVVWYAFVYRIQHFIEPMQNTVAALEALPVIPSERSESKDLHLPSRPRITAVVSSDSDPMAMLSYYGKFWLEDRLTVYWTGSEPPPWYVDATGPAPAAASATRAAYLVGLPGVGAQCPGATRIPLTNAASSLPIEVVATPPGGCAPSGGQTP
jgi:hypothetical protein